MGNNRKLTQAIRLALAFSAVATAGIGSATAQVAPPASTSDSADLQEVIVTGTRIQRKDFESAAPVVSVDSTFLKTSGAVSLVDTLNALPQLTPGLTTTSNNPGGSGVANIDLRGLGPERTLVLLDGTRAMPQDSSGVIDLNTIPASLIDRVEILTGGASSAYGSDAVAGVVNIVTKRNFEGVKIDAGYGADSHHSDGKTRSIGITLGGNFADGKGNAVVSLSMDNRDAVFQGDRGFSAVTLGSGLSPSGSSTLPGGRERNWFGNAANPFGANRPTQAAFDQVFGAYGFAPGTCLNSNAVGFNPNGSLFCRNGANAGANLTPGQPGYVVGGGAVNFNYGALNYLQLPETRKQIFQMAHYDVNDHVEIYDRAYFTSYTATSALAPTPVAPVSSVVDGNVVTNEFTVPYNNPTIPAALQTLLASRPDPTAPFAISRRTTELGLRENINSNNVYQILAGAKGDFSIVNHPFKWDVYGSYGYGSNPSTISGDISVSAFQGILNGTTSIGSCNQSNFNIFGLGNFSKDCQAAVGETNLFSQIVTQTNYEGTLQTDLFPLPGGAATIVVGADWRKNTYAFTPDAPSETGDAYGLNSGPVPAISGENSVSEYFAEVNLPILADLPLVKRLDADLSYRYSDYVIGGGVNTYGATLDYKPIEQLSFRSSFAHAARAPTLANLFSPPSSSSPGYVDPCDTSNGPITPQVQALCIKQGVPAADYAPGGGGYTAPNSQVQSTLSGNTSVKPETSDSFTFGVVWQSTFAGDQQFKTSVDYWRYIVKNEIGTVGANTSLAFCFDGANQNPTYDPNNVNCQKVQRNANGDVENIFDPTTNLGSLKTAGIDWEVDYALPLSAFGLPSNAGKFTVNLLMTFLRESEYEQFAGGPFVDTKGTISDVLASPLSGAQPSKKGLARFGYTVSDVTVGWTTRYIAHMNVINDDGSYVTSGVAPSTPSYFTHQISVGWAPGNFDIVGGVSNVFNVQPPIYTTDAQAGVQANTDPSSYDVLGRRFYINASYKF
jgi:outer membrane receptor protein involved in Fe transport